jgi:hypothetical protein
MKSPKLSSKSSLFLLGLLTILLRYPITPAPTGTDSFYYISMTKSIILSGQIVWAENIVSLYGLFPGTTPLGSTLLASTVTSVTGLSIFEYILIHTIFLSLMSTFGFFMLTGELTDNFRSRWFAALCFSFAPRFLTFSMWRISLRFSFIALLPFFIWLLLRLSHTKYGRYPLRIISLLLLLGLILPSLHRMGLLFPGILLAFVMSILFYYWQESATNRERAGRQVLGFLLFLSGYFFYLQYLDFSPYNPDHEIIGVYFFSGPGIFSSMFNLIMYYMINVGPFLFISILGIVFWVQKGRVSQGYFFSMSYLALSFFVISDILYIPYLVTFGILLLIVPGMDFFIDNLEDNPNRLAVLFSVFTILISSFSYYDLDYRINAHEREEVYYTYYVRESSISASQWMGENLEDSILESNDQKRERRLAAYSNMVAMQDSNALSSGLISIEKMDIERISIKEMYWEAEDHLWVWNNSSEFSVEIQKNISISAVNLGMPDSSGKSSTLSIISSSYYESMPDFTYRMYSNAELAVYWTLDY